MRNTVLNRFGTAKICQKWKELRSKFVEVFEKSVIDHEFVGPKCKLAPRDPVELITFVTPVTWPSYVDPAGSRSVR